MPGGAVVRLMFSTRAHYHGPRCAPPDAGYQASESPVRMSIPPTRGRSRRAGRLASLCGCRRILGGKYAGMTNTVAVLTESGRIDYHSYPADWPAFLSLPI